MNLQTRLSTKKETLVDELRLWTPNYKGSLSTGRNSRLLPLFVRDVGRFSGQCWFQVRNLPPGIPQYLWQSNRDWRKRLLEWGSETEMSNGIFRYVLGMDVETAANCLERALAGLGAQTPWQKSQAETIDIYDFAFSRDRVSATGATSVSRILKPFPVIQISTWRPGVFLDISLDCEAKNYDVFVDCGDRVARGYIAVFDQLDQLPSDGPILRFDYTDVVDRKDIVVSANLRRLPGVFDEDSAERRFLLTIKRAESTWDVSTRDIDDVDVDCTVLLESFY
jgi:hypothetical protein